MSSFSNECSMLRISLIKTFSIISLLLCVAGVIFPYGGDVPSEVQELWLSDALFMFGEHFYVIRYVLYFYYLFFTLTYIATFFQVRYSLPIFISFIAFKIVDTLLFKWDYSTSYETVVSDVYWAIQGVLLYLLIAARSGKSVVAN